MGVQHFKLMMVPKAFFNESRSPVPSRLTKAEIDAGGEDGAGWWSSVQPSPLALEQLRQLCPANKSWGDTEEYVTADRWGTDVRLWKTGGRVWNIELRYSPAVDDPSLLFSFTAIARREHCLLLDKQTGALFEADDKVVIEHLKASRAFRFSSDPKAAIIEAAKETTQ